jgi:phosphoglycolate phosphatase
LAIRAVIFDLDGTLLDTLQDLRLSLEEALRGLGLPAAFDDGAFRLMVGNGARRLIVRALPADMAGDAALAETVRASFREAYGRNLCRLTRPYPGVEALLARLGADGLRLGVLSNKDEDSVVILMDHFFPGRFVASFGAREGRPLKPAPQGGLELAGLLGADPGEIFYLGDSEVDMETALACGFRPLGVAWGFRSREALLGAGALAVLDEPGEMYRHMGAGHGRP